MCCSDESPPARNHSSKYALFKVSPVGIENTCSRAPFFQIQKCWCGNHCHHVLANFWTRQSRPSLFFPRVCTFSVVTTMLVVRSLKNGRPSLQRLAKWRNLPGGVHWSLHVVPRVLVFLEGWLLLGCLAHAWSAPRFRLFRSGTASFASCIVHSRDAERKRFCTFSL